MLTGRVTSRLEADAIGEANKGVVLPEWVTLAAQEVHTLSAKLDVAHANSRGPQDKKAAIDVGRAQAMIEVGVGVGDGRAPERDAKQQPRGRDEGELPLLASQP